jgi:anti-sigma factor RsiW/cytoskeletal protein CcmA (bactofilin family)
MSCPNEITLCAYVDGELPAPRVRHLESHLVTCLDCRGRVLALREEAALLADALHERAPEVFAVAPAAVPARGLAFSFPLAIAVASVVLAVVGALAEARLPGGLGFLSPLRLMGVPEMLFDLVFLLRDRTPGLLELGLSVAVVVSVSALGSFALSAVVRRLAGTAGLVLALLWLAAPRPSAALELRSDEEVTVPAGQVVDQTLLVGADVVNVDGVVRGDLLVAAERLTLRGTVEGNLFFFAQEAEITGRVEGVVHGLAERLRMDGEARGLGGAFERLVVASDGKLERDLIVAAESANLDGEVGRDAWLFGERLELRGRVGRDVDARAEQLALFDGARVGGDLDARLPEGEEVEQAPGARVVGEIRVTPRTSLHRHYLAHWREPHFYAFLLIQFAASFVTGLLLYALVPRLFASEVTTARAFLGAVGWGFLLLVGAPVALILVALTVVGIPVALMGLFVYLTALYVADILVGALIGRSLLQPGPRLGAFGRALLLGLGIVILGHALPFIGPAVGVVSLLLGLGLAGERVRSWRWS